MLKYYRTHICWSQAVDTLRLSRFGSAAKVPAQRMLKYYSSTESHGVKGYAGLT